MTFPERVLGTHLSSSHGFKETATICNHGIDLVDLALVLEGFP